MDEEKKPRCLLCGWEKLAAHSSFPSCNYCASEAESLSEEEASCLLKLDEIPAEFEIWSYGRREDSEAWGQVTKNAVPVEQPARILEGLPLFLGDLDDANDVKKLQTLGIGCVINLCADKIAKRSRTYKYVTSQLAEAKIHQHILVADDARHYNILGVAEVAISIISHGLAQPPPRNGVLVHCWGGVNRSTAVLVAFLVTKCKVPLYAAVARSMKRRGCILTNQSFRAQLVRYCYQHAFDLNGEDIPSELLQPSPASAMTPPAAAAWPEPEEPCSEPEPCSDPQQHQKAPPKDSHDHSLRFATRDGCLNCVKHFLEQGADPHIAGQNYTAIQLAERNLRKADGDHKRRKYQDILTCLQNHQ